MVDCIGFPSFYYGLVIVVLELRGVDFEFSHALAKLFIVVVASSYSDYFRVENILEFIHFLSTVSIRID